MLRRALARLLAYTKSKLSLRRKKTELPVEAWLRKLRNDYAKKRLLDPAACKLDMTFNPLSNEEDINCPCHSGAPCCDIHPYGPGADASEELAFLEWLEDRGITLPKKDILRNDGKWCALDAHYNPMDQTEDYFIPHVA